MISNLNKLIILIISILTTSCTYLDFKNEANDEIKSIEGIEINNIENLQITTRCKSDNIQDYIKLGWVIVDTKSREIPCSWKSIKSTPKCNINKDKGCRIKVPDKIGEETTYYLERETQKKQK